MSNSMSMFGTFREEGALSSGDRYSDAQHKLSRHKGKQFGVPFPKKDKPSPPPVMADPYHDFSEIDMELQKRPGQRISSAPFCPGKSNTKMGTPGGTDACLGEVPLNTEPDRLLYRPASACKGPVIRDPAAAKRNFYTSSPRRGGPGQMIQCRTMMGQQETYAADEYARARILEKEMKAQARARIVRPFVSSVKDRPSSASTLYHNPPETYRRPAKPRPASGQERVWRPSSGRKEGLAYSLFNPVLHMPDPVIETKFHKSEKGAPPAFKPPQGPKKRLSMWAVNPYDCDARPAPSADFTLL